MQSASADHPQRISRPAGLRSGGPLMVRGVRASVNLFQAQVASRPSWRDTPLPRDCSQKLLKAHLKGIHVKSVRFDWLQK